MSQEPTQTNTEPTTVAAQAPASAGTPSAVPAIDPEAYQALSEYAQQVQPFIEAVTPYAERVSRYVQDENYRRFVDEAYDTYEAQVARQKKTEIPEVVRPLYDMMKPVVDDYQSRLEREKQTIAQQQQQVVTQNTEYAKRLVSEHPSLAEDNYAGVVMLANWAGSQGISLEDAWKRKGQLFTAASSAPPRSLHDGAAAPHVPGASKPAPIKTKADLKARLRSALAKGA